MARRVYNFLQEPVHIAPLVTFRIIIGAMLIFSTARFLYLGWVEDHYIDPVFHFTYFGFEWVKPLPLIWMYVVYFLMILAALCVMVGFYFRLFSVLLFLSFSYVELIDLTYYLNHYYFVSLVLFLLIFTPANKYFSFDSRRNHNVLPPIFLGFGLLYFKCYWLLFTPMPVWLSSIMIG